MFREAWEFNHPLVCRKVLPHAGSLPARWGFLEVSSPNVVVSALKPSREGVAVLRVYEGAGQPAPGVKIVLRAKIASAHTANLLEDFERELTVEGDAVSVDLRPFQIQTIRLRLGDD
jgi:alpha-mannosidase